MGCPAAIWVKKLAALAGVMGWSVSSQIHMLKPCPHNGTTLGSKVCKEIIKLKEVLKVILILCGWCLIRGGILDMDTHRGKAM